MCDDLLKFCMYGKKTLNMPQVDQGRAYRVQRQCALHQGAGCCRAKQAQHASHRDDGLCMRKVKTCAGSSALHTADCWLVICLMALKQSRCYLLLSGRWINDSVRAES